MASTALEEKINKIRLRNEEIKRRYEEVEADKKNAAKLDALIQPVPFEDWPERKEPPEFSGSVAKHTGRPKHAIRKHNDQGAQYYPGSGEGKKTHTFADGQGPPPDPKYNFLADSEREERANEIPKDPERNRGKNKPSRGGFRRRGSGRDWHAKEHWNQHENPADMTHPEYEAWRAERNRIDEARISRQRTAEGNWRREWDNDKIHLADDVTKRENRVTLGDVQSHNENEQKHYRSPRAATRISHQSSARESHQASAFYEPIKGHGAVDNEKRLVIATEKSIKVLLNPQGTAPPKSSVMSVKVNSPNIAGTGRVGPRQRPRVTYSSQSETDSPNNENPSLTRQKSIDENTRARNLDQTHNKTTSPKSPHHQRKNEARALYPAKKDNNGEGTTKSSRRDGEIKVDGTLKSLRKDSQKSPHVQRRAPNYPPKSPRVHRKSAESFKNDLTKSPQQENIPVSILPEEVTGGNVDPAPPAGHSFVQNSSNDLLGQVESKDNEEANFEAKVVPESPETSEENDNAPSGQVELEKPVCNTGKDDLESLGNNLPDNSTSNEDEKILDGNEIDADEAKYNKSLDDVESSVNRAIDCSADSGLTSNDSGFIELPSNDSVHDISDNRTLEISKTDENCSECGPSTNRTGENDPIIEIPDKESKITGNEKVDAEPSSSDSKYTVDDLRSEVSGEVEKSFENTANDTGSTSGIETIGTESREKEPVKTVKSAEIPENTEDSREPFEAPIVSISSKNDGEENTDESELAQARNLSAHEEDKNLL